MYFYTMKITIIGCGNMGMVYARAFLRYNIATRENLLLVEKSETRKEELRSLDLGRVVLPDDPAIATSSLIILAVKPQDFLTLAPALAQHIRPGITVLSIMAGVRMQLIEEQLGTREIVRAMPNSPVEINMGMTGVCAHEAVSPDNIRKTEQLLATTGRTVFFEREEMLDAVTALSGSGPAYFFYLVKAMTDAGVQMGMDEAVSATLVKQTMLGAFHLINNGGKSNEELIRTVASRGGTTEAAFTVFNEKQIAASLQQGILRARDRAEELSNG